MWGGLISLDQVSYRAPEGKQFKAKDDTGPWSTNFILKISFVQRILIWRNFLWKKSHCTFFFPWRATCFWCNIVLMSFFYQFNSANDQKHSYFAIWENESASFLFCRCVIHCFWEDSLLLYVTIFSMPINEYYHIL